MAAILFPLQKLTRWAFETVLAHLPYPVLCEINLSLFSSFFLDNERMVSLLLYLLENLVPPVLVKTDMQQIAHEFFD